MNHLVTNFLKSTKVFFIFQKANFLSGLEYRLDILTGVLATAVYLLSFTAFTSVIFSKVKTINGWTFDQMLTFFALEQIFFYGSYLFFKPSLVNFSESIKNGTLDQTLKLPVSARLVVSFKDQRPDLILPIIFTSFLLIYSLRDVSLLLPNILIFFALTFCGFFILYNVMFIFSSLAFWLTESDELVELSAEVSQLGRFPPSIFPIAAQAFIFFIIPAALMIFVPATAIMGILDLRLAFLSIIMTVLTFIISEVIWHKGLKQYSSASS